MERPSGQDAGVDVTGLVLAEVRDAGPETVAQIAANCQIPASTARDVLRRLERSGLVESSNYQRRARVYLPAEEEG